MSGAGIAIILIGVCVTMLLIAIADIGDWMIERHEMREASKRRGQDPR